MKHDNVSSYEELRQMKSDYEYLKADMDKQTIINRQLMDAVLRNKVRVLDSNRKNTMTGVCAAILITLAAAYIKELDMYLAGAIAACYLLILIGYGYIYHKLGKIEYGSDNVLATVTRLRKFKRDYMFVNIISWILAAGLMYLVFPEIHHTFRTPERGIAAMIFLCVAVLAGICIQYFIDRKILSSCNDIIDHLKDGS